MFVVFCYTVTVHRCSRERTCEIEEIAQLLSTALTWYLNKMIPSFLQNFIFQVSSVCDLPTFFYNTDSLLAYQSSQYQTLPN